MMGFLKGFSLTNIDGVLLALILMAISAFIIYYFYKNIYPPNSKTFRLILRSLRSVVFVVLSIQLAMLAINWSIMSEEKKVVAILLDGSRSMAQYEETPYSEILETVEKISSSLEDKVKVEKYIFDSDLRELKADAQAVGDLTDISKSLKSLEKGKTIETMSAVILLSDGQWNQGEPPDIRSNLSDIPIYVVGFGNKEKSRDTRISSVKANSVTFSGDSIKITVSLLSTGFSGKKTEIRISGEGIRDKIKIVTLPEDGFAKDVEFYLKFDSEGDKSIEVNLSTLDGESTDSNNKRRIIVSVISKKKKLLLLGGAPSAEYVYIKNLLDSSEDFDVTTLVQSGKGKWYESGGLQLDPDYDLFIFAGYPSVRSSDRDIELLKQELMKNQISLLFLNTGSTDYDRINSFESSLPVKIVDASNKIRYGEGILSLEDEGNFHPFTKQSDFLNETVEAWQNLPPAYFPLLNLDLKEKSRVLLSMRTGKTNNKTNFPVLIVLEEGLKKNAMIMTLDSHNFDRLLRGIGEPSSTWRKTLINGVKWLSSHELPKRVSVTTEKKIYSQGEKIRFSAQVYDESYDLVDDASLSIEIISETDLTEVFVFDLQNRSNGSYAGEYISKYAGEFGYKAVAKRGDLLIGEFEGNFGVETYSPELDNLFRNDLVLIAIAEKSGGRYFPFESFNQDSLDIQSGTIIEKSNKTFEAWSNQILMIVLLTSLGVEWYMRKRGGLL